MDGDYSFHFLVYFYFSQFGAEEQCDAVVVFTDCFFFYIAKPNSSPGEFHWNALAALKLLIGELKQIFSNRFSDQYRP